MDNDTSTVLSHLSGFGPPGVGAPSPGGCGVAGTVATTSGTVVTTSPTNNGRPRLSRWATFRCPICGGEHRDLEPYDAPRRTGLARQICDRCYRDHLSDAAWAAYLRWRVSVAPPDTQPEVPQAVAQAALPFGDGDDTPPPKGPPGPWEDYLKVAESHARLWEVTSPARRRKGRRG